MKLISATILPEKNFRGETQVSLTWETLLVSRQGWRALHAALDAREIPKQTTVETRAYGSRELAERAIIALGGEVAA